MAGSVLKERLYRSWFPDAGLVIARLAAANRVFLNPFIFLACWLIPSPDLAIGSKLGRGDH